jgi:hypothetical protein
MGVVIINDAPAEKKLEIANKYLTQEQKNHLSRLLNKYFKDSI